HAQIPMFLKSAPCKSRYVSNVIELTQRIRPKSICQRLSPYRERSIKTNDKRICRARLPGRAQQSIITALLCNGCQLVRLTGFRRKLGKRKSGRARQRCLKLFCLFERLECAKFDIFAVLLSLAALPRA